MARRPPAIPDRFDGIDHGTGGALVRCRTRYGTCCEECRAYMRRTTNRHRMRRPDRHQRSMDRSGAYDRALRALARRHPAELEELRQAELALLCDDTATEAPTR